MNIKDKLINLQSVFIDTAPIIYFIEGHSEYGEIVKKIITSCKEDRLFAYTSVLTITEVLPKPISQQKNKLVEKFMTFLKESKNLNLISTTEVIAETAGRLRGKYSSLRTLDALQIATAIEFGTDAFITNDIKLKTIDEVEIIVLKDFL